MSDSEAEIPKEEDVTISVKLPEKLKKPRSEKQKESIRKAFETLKAKREANAKEVAEVKEKKAKAKTQWKNISQQPPEASLVTKKDLDGMMEFMKANFQPVTKIVEKERIVEKPVEKIVERVVERIPPPAAPQKLSGHALLDQLFFK